MSCYKNRIIGSDNSPAHNRMLTVEFITCSSCYKVT